MSAKRRMRVSLLGEGREVERWATALQAHAELRPWPEQPSGAIDALVLAPGTADPFARAKEALLADVSVLYAAPFALSPWQARVLSDLSCRQHRLLRFVELFQYRKGYAFLRRLLQGQEPFWRPLYLRTLCLAQRDGSARIDELATEELAICEGLLDGTPQYVTASAARGCEMGEVCAAFLIVHYSEGPLVQCTISLTEAGSARRVVAVTPDRTVIMDDLDATAPLRIMGGAEQGFIAEESAPTALCRGHGDKLLASPCLDPVAEEAARFLRAVALGDRSLANGGRWTRVAGLWWAARQSMSFGGPTDVPLSTTRAGDAEPPPLRVIEGGGRTARTAWQRPALTVVAR